MFKIIQEIMKKLNMPLLESSSPYISLLINSTTQSISNNAATDMVLDTQLTGCVNNGNFSTVSTGLKIPFAGIYIAIMSVQFPVSATGVRSAYFLQNSVGTSQHGYICIPGSSDKAVSVTATAMMNINTGDLIRPIVYQDSGSAVNIGAVSTNPSEFFVIKVA